jgi:hypothetical protein
MAETKADGPIEPNRMEEFLEDDSERNVFQQNFFQEVSSFDENSFLQHANECLLALFIRSIKQKEKRILTDLENSSDQSDLLSTLRSELLENRKNPPQLIFSDQHTRYSHA